MYNIPLEAGDVIIMATDGMFDNLWPEAMLEIVNKVRQSSWIACPASALHSVSSPYSRTSNLGMYLGTLLVRSLAIGVYCRRCRWWRKMRCCTRRGLLVVPPS